MPVREVPRDVHGERARSDDQEDRGTDDRGGALHDRSLLNAAADRADWASAGVGRRLREVLVAFEPAIEVARDHCLATGVAIKAAAGDRLVLAVGCGHDPRLSRAMTRGLKPKSAVPRLPPQRVR